MLLLVTWAKDIVLMLKWWGIVYLRILTKCCPSFVDTVKPYTTRISNVALWNQRLLLFVAESQLILSRRVRKLRIEKKFRVRAIYVALRWLMPPLSVAIFLSTHLYQHFTWCYPTVHNRNCEPWASSRLGLAWLLRWLGGGKGHWPWVGPGISPRTLQVTDFIHCHRI